MEREESELIERLKHSQERHRIAYLQLEEALSDVEGLKRPRKSTRNLKKSIKSPRKSSKWIMNLSISRANFALKLAEDVLRHSELSTPSTASLPEASSLKRPQALACRPPLPRAPPGARRAVCSRAGHRQSLATVCRTRMHLYTIMLDYTYVT